MLGNHASTFHTISQNMVEIFSVPQHKDFTDHSPKGHSERIIDILNVLCEEMMRTEKKLNEDEIFILLASAYVHDVGMQYGKDKRLSLMDVRGKHEKLTTKMIKASIARRPDYPDLGIPPEWGEEIIKVSEGHRNTDIQDGKYDTIVEGVNKPIRLRLLAALLLLADDLDITHHRVIMRCLHLREVPQASRVRWWLCHYVEGVAIEEGRVCVRYRFPTKRIVEYRSLIPPIVKAQLQKSLNQVEKILWDNGIKLHLEEGKVEKSQMKEAMTRKDLDYLARTRIQNEAPSFLQKAMEPIGLNAKQRIYNVRLNRSKTLSVLEGKVLYKAIVKNEAEETKYLFPDGRVLDGQTTIPAPLRSKLPENPEAIASFGSLIINGKPAKLSKKIEYIPREKPQLVMREIVCQEKIEPGAICRIEYSERLLFEEEDNFTRRFKYLSFGVLKVHMRHPVGIEPDISWHTSPESSLHKRTIRASLTRVIFSAEGKWMPGDGFLLSWKKKIL